MSNDGFHSVSSLMARELFIFGGITFESRRLVHFRSSFGEIMNSAAIHGVFVTGGAGIGSHIVDRLAQAAANVTIYDNFSTGQRFISHHAGNPKVSSAR